MRQRELTVAQSRNDARKAFTTEHRVILLEQDVDEHDDMAAEIKAMRGVLLQILVGVAVACVMLAINVAVKIG